MRFGFFLLILCGLVGTANSQQFAVGIKGGIRPAADFSGFSAQSWESKRYIAGPTVELRLPWRLSVEADALYRPIGYTITLQSCCGYAIIRERSNSWEFPLLVKYRFPGRLVHPLAGVGYDPRLVHGTDVSSGSYLSGISTNPPASIYTSYFGRRDATDYSVTHGIVVSVGIEVGARHLRISPEFRYVHWNAPFLDQTGGDGSYRIQSAQDEFFVLLGISFH